jgi:hypothetical protein
LQILHGGRCPSDLQPLYDIQTGLLRLQDNPADIAGDDWNQFTRPSLKEEESTIPGGADLQFPVKLTPNIWAFRSLFRCFAGAVADLNLPKGAFFSGSSVLAATIIPCDLATPEIIALLTERGKEHWRLSEIKRRVIDMMAPGDSEVRHLMIGFLGTEEDAIEDLRAEITKLVPERDTWETTLDDPMYWTWNGFGVFRESDIDIFLAAETLDEADRMASKIYRLMMPGFSTLGEDMCCVRTPNTVTFCRSYPERHVQMILYTMEKVHHHIAFADLDCTAMALVGAIPYTSARSRAALSSKSNVVPTSMLLNRRDSGKRIAQYMKRGFVPKFLSDPRVPDISTPISHFKEELKYRGHTILDLALLAECRLRTPSIADDHELTKDIAHAVQWLAENNTSYHACHIPRMIDLSASGIKRFFQTLNALNAGIGDDVGSVITLISEVSAIPACSRKLEKAGLETWARWGMIET